GALSRQREPEADGRDQRAVRLRVLRSARALPTAQIGDGGERSRVAAVRRAAVGLLLPALPRLEAAADDEGAGRVQAWAGLLLLLQRCGCRPQPGMVGRGQPAVVERLSALER